MHKPATIFTATADGDFDARELSACPAVSAVMIAASLAFAAVGTGAKAAAGAISAFGRRSRKIVPHCEHDQCSQGWRWYHYLAWALIVILFFGGLSAIAVAVY